MKSHLNQVFGTHLHLLAVCLLAGVLVTGCGGSSPSEEDRGPDLGVYAGMSEAQVVEVLGDPIETMTYPEMETMRILEYDEVSVYIEDDKVISVVQGRSEFRAEE